jgi:PKD repeat protein
MEKEGNIFVFIVLLIFFIISISFLVYQNYEITGNAINVGEQFQKIVNIFNKKAIVTSGEFTIINNFPKGLKQQTAEERKQFLENTPAVKNVQLNDLALKRINEERVKKGLKEIKVPTKKFGEEVQTEIINVTLAPSAPAAAPIKGGGKTIIKNQIPVAVISASPLSGNSPLTVSFSGASSYDIDGKIVSYYWAFGDGSTFSSVSPTIDHAYVGSGSFTAKLTVYDNSSGSGTSSININTMGTALPSFVDNSKLKYFPPIGSQIGGSCASFSATYYLMTYMHALAQDIDAKNGGPDTRFSTKWTYDMVNDGVDGGSWYYQA